MIKYYGDDKISMYVDDYN